MDNNHFYSTINYIKHNEVKPTKNALENFKQCKAANDLKLPSDLKDLNVNDDVYFKFNNDKCLGKIDCIIRDPNGSRSLFIGGKFGNVPDVKPMHSVFEYDNNFFIQSENLEKKNNAKKSGKLLPKINKVNKINKLLLGLKNRETNTEHII